MPVEDKIYPKTGEVIEDSYYNPIKIGSINNIDSDLYTELKDSYYGGHVYMYKPSGPIADCLLKLKVSIAPFLASCGSNCGAEARMVSSKFSFITYRVYYYK